MVRPGTARRNGAGFHDCCSIGRDGDIHPTSLPNLPDPYCRCLGLLFSDGSNGSLGRRSSKRPADIHIIKVKRMSFVRPPRVLSLVVVGGCQNHWACKP